MKPILAILLTLSTSAMANSYEDLARRVEILTDEINQLKAGQTSASTGESVHGLGEAASKAYLVNEGLSIGGYGEIIYNHKEAKDESGDTQLNDPTTEALRNIIYLGYKYNDKWLVNSEIEIEHVNKVYTEFLYVDYLKSEHINFRFGLSLVPMGITNELHEPINFNSVNRPEVEKYLIPTTWRENGLGLFGSIGKLSYKSFVFNGPNAEAIEADSGIIGSRKKGGSSSTNASTIALVNRVDYNLNSSSFIGASILTGSASTETKTLKDLELFMAEVHGVHTWEKLELKYLYSLVNYNNASDWNEQSGVEKLPNAMNGYYVNLAYKMGTYVPFFRYEAYNLNSEVDSDTYGDAKENYDRTNTVVGINIKPIEQIVFKFDYTIKKTADEKGINEFNAGLGYIF